jgi:hypothetical protein
LKNKEKPKPLPFGNNNNLSRISNNSSTIKADSILQSNKNDALNNNPISSKPQPGFMDRLKDQKKDQQQKNDFWSDFLNEEKSKETPKAPAPKPPVNPAGGNKGTFHDVADLEEEFILN